MRLQIISIRRAWLRRSLGAVLVFAAAFLAPATGIASDEYGFDMIAATWQGHGSSRFAEIAPPVIIGGVTYFKAYSLNPEGKPVFGIYRATGNGIDPIFVADGNVPGTDEPFLFINSFDMQEGKLVFVGGGDKEASYGIYLFDGEDVRVIVNSATKIPHRNLTFEVFNDVYFADEGIVFSGGRENREGIFFFDDEGITIITHKPIALWQGRRNLPFPRLGTISFVTRTEGQILIGSAAGSGEERHPTVLRIEGKGLVPWHEDADIDGVFSGFTAIRDVWGTPEHFSFYGFTEGKKGLRNGEGGLYSVHSGTLQTIADNTTPLWSELPHGAGALPATPVEEGDVLSPAPELYFKKYTNNFPFWRTVFSVYELQGMYQEYYLDGFYVGSEVRPIRPIRKLEHFWGEMGRAIGAGIAAALTGGVPLFTPRNETKFAHLQEQAVLGYYASEDYSWSNYFLVPLSVGQGGFSASGNRIVFHGANLVGQSGLFLYEDGEITKIIDNSDRLGGNLVVNLYIGFDGFQGEEIVFWAEVAGARDNDFEQVLVRARRQPVAEFEQTSTAAGPDT